MFNEAELELLDFGTKLGEHMLKRIPGGISFAREWSTRTGLVTLLKVRAKATGATTLLMKVTG